MEAASIISLDLDWSPGGAAVNMCMQDKVGV
jgi:hypothetical protein